MGVGDCEECVDVIEEDGRKENVFCYSRVGVVLKKKKKKFDVE